MAAPYQSDDIWAADSQKNQKSEKSVATRCKILRQKCTKIDFGWGFAPDVDEEITALPQTL